MTPAISKLTTGTDPKAGRAEAHQQNSAVQQCQCRAAGVGNGWSSLGNPLLAGAYFTGGILHTLLFLQRLQGGWSQQKRGGATGKRTHRPLRDPRGLGHTAVVSDDVVDDERALATGRKTALLVIKQQGSVMATRKSQREREGSSWGVG